MSDFLPQYFNPTPGRYKTTEQIIHSSLRSFDVHAGKFINSLFTMHYHAHVHRFIDIDSNRVVGEHSGSELFTVGQKAKIGGAAKKYFIAQKCSDSECDRVDGGAGEDVSKHGSGSSGSSSSLVPPPRKGDVLVAAGADHWSLRSNVLETPLSSFSWVAGEPPEGLTAAGAGATGAGPEHQKDVIYYLQIRHLQSPIPCTLSVVPSSVSLSEWVIVTIWK